MPKLENWSIVTVPLNPYQAPELIKMRLSGEVYGDTRFDDGAQVTTSSVVALDTVKKVASTNNTEYKLGSIDPPFQSYLDDNGYSIYRYSFNNK